MDQFTKTRLTYRLAETRGGPATLARRLRNSARSGTLAVMALALTVMTAQAEKANVAALERSPAQDAADEILKLEGDIGYGQFLAGECLVCHQESGAVGEIPAIVGVSKDYFVLAIVEYQTNVRDSDVMRLHVESLGDEEVASLAAYFATLEPK